MSNNLRVSLFERADVAAEVGFLIMYTANLEAFLPSLLAKLLRCPEEHALHITEQVDNLSAKLGIIFSVAEMKTRSPAAKKILEMKAAILEAVAFRNKLAHGLFGIDVWHDVTLATYAISGGRRGKPRMERLTPRNVRAATERLRAALERMEREITPPRSWKAYQAQVTASQGKPAQAKQAQGKRQKARKAP